LVVATPYDAYRGSPPCTLSHHPDNRETGYSNVLEEDLRTILEDFEESSEKKPTKVYKKVAAGVKKEKKRSLKELAEKTMALNVFNVETKTRPSCVTKNQFKKRPRQVASNKRRGSLFDE